MRLLTFKGFLHQYLRALSDAGTNDIKRLAEAVPANYRLIEPLILFAAASSKLSYLNKVAVDPVLLEAAQDFPEELSWNDIIAIFEQGKKSALRNEYHKVYKSYISIRDRQKTKNRSKALILNKTRELQQQKNVSTYRLYTDLQLNHGNVNAYLKHSDVGKVSLEVAEKVLTYLEAL